MVRDRLFIVSIVVLIAAYAGLWWFDGLHNDDEGRADIVAAHQAHVVRMNRIDGMILGGSNAAFGLSAEQVGSHLGGRWYNASLLNEGYSWANYRAFVADLATRMDSSAVKVVVYSTIHGRRVDDRAGGLETSADLVGRQRLSARPHRSALSYVQAYLRTGSFTGVQRTYPLPTAFGDFDFTDYPCRFDGRPAEFKKADAELTSRDIVDRAEFLLSLFPGATIVVVVPSEYGNSTIPARSAYLRALLAAFERRVMDGGRRSRIRLVIQDPFRETTAVCDAPHHANSDGRRWRTRALIDALG